MPLRRSERKANPPARYNDFIRTSTPKKIDMNTADDLNDTIVHAGTHDVREDRDSSTAAASGGTPTQATVELMNQLASANALIIATQKAALEQQEARIAAEHELLELKRSLDAQPPTNLPLPTGSSTDQQRSLPENRQDNETMELSRISETIAQQSSVIAALSAQMAAMQTQIGIRNGAMVATPSTSNGSTSAGNPQYDGPLQEDNRPYIQQYNQPFRQMPNQPSNQQGSQPPSQMSGQLSYVGHKRLNDLPPFTGLVTEWPMFLAAFNNSTLAFGYNPMENLFRLQKSLSGEARESVACLLVDAANVDQVIETLRMLYGRPEQLVRSQIESVRSIPPLSEYNLNELPPFAARVQNLATVLDTDATRQHLANPMLIDELVNKLPVSRRMEWAAVAVQTQPYPTVRDFAKWISGIAVLASLVIPATSEPTTSRSSQRRSLPSDRISGR